MEAEDEWGLGETVMMPFRDLTGNRYGRLVVVEPIRLSSTETKFVCKCDCGTVTTVWRQSLVQGHTNSCGCLSREAHTKHGGSWRPEYKVWKALRRRCLCSTDKQYHDYGGRGIKVCQAWDDFSVFFNDVGPRPSAAHSIDRIDNEKGYEPGNVRWATHQQQNSNTRRNRYVSIYGRGMTVAEAAAYYCVPASRILHRLNAGWTDVDAVLRPSRRRK